MISVEQDRAFPGQSPLQLGMRSADLTVVSRVSCAKILRYVAGQEGKTAPWSPLGIIHIHVMNNWGTRPKRIPSEAGDVTKSMVMWLILTRIWMTILELIRGRFRNQYTVWCYINLLRILKRLLYYHWMKKDQFWSNLPPRVWPHSIKPLHRIPYLQQSNSPIWCQVGVDIGPERHDLGPRIPSKHL